MPQLNDLSRSLVALDQDSTIIAVVELSQSSWLVAGVLPGIERQPRKKLEPSAERLLGLLHRWRDEAVRAGKKITRIALAFEAGRDGFWLARWLNARGVEAHVIHPSSVAVSREHRRAKTDRLDTELLKRGFLGWLRGERGHCSMARVPTIAEEDAKRPNRERECLVGERTRIVNRMKATLARLGVRNFKPTLRKAAERLATVHTPEGMPLPPNTLAELQRDMARLGFVVSQIREIEQARQKRLQQETDTGPHAMVRQVARVIGIGIETADMLVNEVLSRPMRDRKAVARYAGLTGSPDESGARRREQGLARAGNARVRRGMIQLAWRFLRFQKQSALAQWYGVVFEVGRQQPDRRGDPGIGRYDDFGDAQRARHFGAVQWTGTAKGDECKAARVEPLLHGARADRVRHVGVDDRQDALRRLFEAQSEAPSEITDGAAGGIGVEPHRAAKEIVGIEPPENQVGVGRLSPRENALGVLLGIGIGHFFAGRFEEARATLLRSVQESPGWVPNYRFLASCCAQMGRLDEAREIVQRLRTLTALVVPSATHWHNPEQRELYLSGLRLAAGEAT